MIGCYTHLCVCNPLLAHLEDWTGKMDPYVVMRCGGRELRTPVMTNAGKKPKFNWTQMVEWHGEPDIHFIVMDSNFMVADGLIGEAVYKGLPLHSDFEGVGRAIGVQSGHESVGIVQYI